MLGEKTICRVKPEKPDELFPDVRVEGGFVAINFRDIMVFSKEETERLFKNVESVWAFLDDPDVKKYIEGPVPNDQTRLS